MTNCKLPSRRSLLSAAALIVMSGVLLMVGCEQTRRPVGESRTVALTDANFSAQALESDKPMLVDFGATWCGPCRQMEPIIASLSVEYADRLAVGTVDVDESRGLAAEYGVQGIPTFIMFRDGQEYARLTGGMDQASFIAWVDQQLTD